jgi:hypothetical protein
MQVRMPPSPTPRIPPIESGLIPYFIFRRKLTKLVYMSRKTTRYLPNLQNLCSQYFHWPVIKWASCVPQGILDSQKICPIVLEYAQSWYYRFYRFGGPRKAPREVRRVTTKIHRLGQSRGWVIITECSICPYILQWAWTHGPTGSRKSDKTIWEYTRSSIMQE